MRNKYCPRCLKQFTEEEINFYKNQAGFDHRRVPYHTLPSICEHDPLDMVPCDGCNPKCKGIGMFLLINPVIAVNESFPIPVEETLTI